MDFLKNLRWVCRVCAINMKEKCPGLASVHIFGPAGINHKLKKYFDIEVSKDDNLPKNICNMCFKRLQDAHYFARLAAKTDRFLKSFVKSTKASLSQKGNPSTDFNTRFQTEFASFALLSENKKSGMLLNQLKKDRPSLVIKPKLPEPNTLDITTDTATRTALKSMPSCTVVTTIPDKTFNNLEEKRKNLKAALATSKTTSTVARIKVKSDSDLKAPQFNQISSPQKDQASQTQSIPRQNEQQTMKVITVPQVTSMPANLQGPFSDQRIKLGQVVKDIDLLTLILKALKWPYTNDNILIQIERLKEAPFHDVIRNQHLLQDADLMQILNTILSPILFQIPMISTPQPVIPAFVSYKIPSDLSVHLITEEVSNAAAKHQPKPVQDSNPKPKKTRAPRKKTVPKPIMRSSTPIEILSDDESVQMFEVNVDPNLFLNAESESQDKFKNNVTPPKVKKNEDMLVFKLQTKCRKRNSSSKRKSDVEAIHETLSNEPEIITPDTPPCLATSPSGPIEITPKEIPIEAATLESKEESQDAEATETPAGDISEDDDIWADFKVIESPDTSAVEIEKNIDISCVKEEPQTDQEELTKEEIITNEKHEDTTETIEEKSEPAKENNDDTNESIEDTNEDKDAKQSNCTEDVDNKEETVTGENGKSQPRKRGRQKTNAKQTSTNKKSEDESYEQASKKIYRENSESKKSGRNSVTPMLTKQTPTSNKRTTRSITASQPSISLRNSNLRRRICKQCGQSFTLLTEFLDHRKTHIEG